MTVDAIVETVRFQVNDYTYIQVNAVEETPATGKLNPQDAANYWNEAATGRDHEEFITQNMPVVSGGDVKLRTGRWEYKYNGVFPDAYSASTGSRVFYFDYARGICVVPSGAIPTISGDKVKLSYPWLAEQEYRFTNTEIKKWIPEGDSYLRNKVTLPYTITGRGDTLAFSEVPSGVYASALSLATSYLIRRRLEEEGLQDGIYVKDGDIAFDTTKTLAHRGKSLQQVKNDLDGAVDDIQTGDLGSAGARIDIYSTRDNGYPYGIGSDQEVYYQEGFPTYYDGDGGEA